MKVLVACEFSGIVRDAFLRHGHDAWSCDLIDTEATPERHIKCDVTTILDNEWDLMIAHPPCTYLTNAGVVRMHDLENTVERWEQMCVAGRFFKHLFDSDIPRICIENPIPHKYAKSIIGNYNQLIHPWQFGHDETKTTCLWLKNLPHLRPTDIVSGRGSGVMKVPRRDDRWKWRSRFWHGIAEAMAEQWGSL